MEVILLERVEKLGQMGDVVTVKPGFARNFLIPKNKALRATAQNKARFEAEKAQLEAHNLERKSEAEAVAGKLADAKTVVIRQAGESGQLYGSVNARDIAASLTESGVAVKRDQVQLPQPIKTLGLHDVLVRLHPEVSVTIVANVARSGEEAVTQAETGAAVVGGADNDKADMDKADNDKTDMDTAVEDASEALLAQAEAVFEEDAAADVIAEVESLTDAPSEADEAEEEKAE